MPQLPPDAKTRSNREWSRRLGWLPADFGATGFGVDLIEAIERIQADRILEVTGVCDARTWAAILAYDAGRDLSDGWRAAKTGAEKARLRRADQTVKFKRSDRCTTFVSRRKRCAAFSGTVLWGAALALAASTSPDAIVLPPGSEEGRTAEQAPSRLIHVEYDPDRRWTLVRQTADAFRSGGWAGCVIEIGEAALTAIIGSRGRSILFDFTESLDAIVGRRPRAAVVTADATDTRLRSQTAQRAISAAVDLIYVPVPHPRKWFPVEPLIDQHLKCWWHRAGVLTNRIGVLIRPKDGTRTEDVLRAREWSARRGIVAIGYDGPIGPLSEAVDCAIPEIRERIDFIG